MDKEQKKVFELLKEFDELCRKNGISYCLNGETLFYAMATGSIGPRPYGAYAIMKGDDCRKFIKAFNDEKPANREIEYWGNSAGYPDFTLRYVATDTTSFNIIDFQNYKTHGFFVEVSILRGKGGRKENVINNALERGIMLNAQNESTDMNVKSGKKELLSDGFYKMKTVIGSRASVREKTFDFFTKSCSKPASQGKGMSGTYLFYYMGKLVKDVSQNYFDNPAVCVIEGHEFLVPREPRTFLRKLFGGKYQYVRQEDWLDDKFWYRENSIVDAETPYAEVLSSMTLDKKELESIIEAKKRIDSINSENKANNKIARNDWQTVQQTGARFRMWKKYMPMKEEILSLDQAGDYLALDKIFEEYSSELDALGDGRSFSFDNEIFDVYIRTLEYRGKFSEADRLIRLLPKSHLEEIDLKLD